MSTSTLAALTIVEAALLVAVLAAALLRLRVHLQAIAAGLKVVAEGVLGVESDLSQIGPLARGANAPLSTIVSALPDIAAGAEREAVRVRAARRR
jgi:hypothetical protein